MDSTRGNDITVQSPDPPKNASYCSICKGVVTESLRTDHPTSEGIFAWSMGKDSKCSGPRLDAHGKAGDRAVCESIVQSLMMSGYR